MYTERAEAFFPLRAIPTAADPKRDARAASDKCADRMKGMQSGGDLNFTLLSVYHRREQPLLIYEPARPRQGTRCAPCQFDEGRASRNV